MKRLIILRGNSASGKTTVATALQKEIGRKTMLLSQDVIRRQILRVSEKEAHPAMELIQIMTRLGWQRGWETVIIEGIIGREKNGEALKELIQEADELHVYYFDVPFEETLRRHLLKPNANDYGEKEMREWWKEKDYLGVEGEKTIGEEPRTDEIIQMILSDLGVRS